MNIENPEPDRVAKEVDRRLLDGALARLGASGSPVLKEIADDLRTGRATLTDLAHRQELAEPFKAAVARYKKWHDGMSEEEREMLLAQTERQVQRMREQVAEELAAEAAEGE